jgi:hypothetical protein
MLQASEANGTLEMLGANHNRLSAHDNLRVEASSAIFELRIETECVVCGIEKLIGDHENDDELVARLRKVVSFAQRAIQSADAVEATFQAYAAESGGMNKPD